MAEYRTIYLDAEQDAAARKLLATYRKAHGIEPSWGELVKLACWYYEAELRKQFPEARK